MNLIQKYGKSSGVVNELKDILCSKKFTQVWIKIKDKNTLYVHLACTLMLHYILEHIMFADNDDDVIDRSTKTVQHSIKNISGNVKAVFLKLGTRNVHRKRNKINSYATLC